MQSPDNFRGNALLLRRSGPVDVKSTGPRRSLRRVAPVASFVCAMVPGTTRKHAPAPWTALPRLRPACAGPTRSTLIRVRRFNHRLTPAGTGYHSGSHTPCTVSLTLRYSSHVGRTHSSRPFRHVRGSRPGIVSSALGALISRARIQKLPSTHPDGSFPIRLRLCCG